MVLGAVEKIVVIDGIVVAGKMYLDAHDAAILNGIRTHRVSFG